jgi:pimeloyl-ACP methyl ester carboxylesterase
MTLRKFAAMAACVLTTSFSGLAAQAQTAAPVMAKNVVLVHGAWADGSSWGAVIPILQAAGSHVTSLQTSLADSVAETRRALALQDGPTVLARRRSKSSTGTDRI